MCSKDNVAKQLSGQLEWLFWLSYSLSCHRKHLFSVKICISNTLEAALCTLEAAVAIHLCNCVG